MSDKGPYYQLWRDTAAALTGLTLPQLKRRLAGYRAYHRRPGLRLEQRYVTAVKIEVAISVAQKEHKVFLKTIHDYTTDLPLWCLPGTPFGRLAEVADREPWMAWPVIAQGKVYEAHAVRQILDRRTEWFVWAGEPGTPKTYIGVFPSVADARCTTQQVLDVRPATYRDCSGTQ